MKNDKGHNRGQNGKNISFYSIGKTLYEKFPEWYRTVVEHHNTDLPISLIPEFIGWYREVYGTEQEYTYEEGCNSEYEYRDQLTICAVILFQTDYFTTKKIILRTRLRTVLSSETSMSPSTISHRLLKMKFKSGDVVPFFKPMINSAKITAETFCLERGIDRKFDIEDALVLQHEADEWMLNEVIGGGFESDDL